MQEMEIKCGTSGFSFNDWRGTVYPSDLKDSQMLPYYAYHYGFDTVEINSTYYAIPSEKSFQSMCRRTPSGFEFTVKAHKTMTHDPFDPRLERKPGIEDIEESFRKFKEALRPLWVFGKLGAILLQFPVFFPNTKENRDYILFCLERLKDLPVVVEFRHRSWVRDESFEFLKENGIGFCAVDEPPLPRLMPFIPRVTSDIGYIRFHGRNKNWFNAPLSERYDYFYSDEELKSFIPKIMEMMNSAKKLYIFFNNCHMGQALRNAIRFKELLAEYGILKLKSD